MIRASFRRESGFSLLEMVVAMAILGLTLGALYQAVGGATRNVRADERYAYGVELARSLVANYSEVPVEGLSASGETAGGYNWRVTAVPLDIEMGRQSVATLASLEVIVSWPDGSRWREVQLDSVVVGSLGTR